MSRKGLWLCLGALVVVACDFGASNFKIVPFDDSGDGDGDLGDGDGDVGTGGGTGDGDGDLGGAGASGDGDGDGSGGESGITYACNVLGSPELLLSDVELANHNWNSTEGPFLVPMSSQDVIMVAEFEKVVMMPDPYQTSLMMRFVQDSQSSPVGPLFTYDYVAVGGRGLSATHFANDELLLVSKCDEGVLETRIPILNGNNFGTPFEAIIPAPMECTPVANAHVRDVFADFSTDPPSYAITCQTNMNPGEVRPYYQAGSEWSPLGNWVGDSTGRILDFALVDGTHFIMLGDELGQLSYRVGVGSAQLLIDHSIALDDERLTSLSFAQLNDDSGLFFLGAAVTGPADAPDLVPAQFFAGSVPIGEIENLSDAVPPEALIGGELVTSLSGLVMNGRPTQYGQFIYVPGISLTPGDAAFVTMLDLAGNVVVKDFEVSQVDDSDMGQATPTIVRLGIGMFQAYSQDSELYGRSILCGPN